ncbi:MAG: glycosyltransferase family 2 protein, partial [Candidatus Heimdallarchaeaceae archaeon]
MVIYPKVSILCTSYNNEMVRDAIRGVLVQTYKNWELIILDDNSNQKTLNIYKEFSDPRIKFYNSHVKEKDRLKVCPYARQINVGLKMATGKIVMYLTDDSVYEPHKLKTVIKYFGRHPRVRVVYNRQKQVNGKLTKILAPDRILKRAFRK